MLETIREYGLEMLAASGELETMRHAHAVYYLTLSEKAESELEDVHQADLLPQDFLLTPLSIRPCLFHATHSCLLRRANTKAWDSHD